MNEWLIPFIEVFEVIEWDEKVYAYHRGHVVELNLENFFNENLYDVDDINISKLGSSRRSHKESFILKI